LKVPVAAESPPQDIDEEDEVKMIVSFDAIVPIAFILPSTFRLPLLVKTRFTPASRVRVAEADTITGLSMLCVPLCKVKLLEIRPLLGIVCACKQVIDKRKLATKTEKNLFFEIKFPIKIN
jgi:hypothetical protein